MRPVVKTVAVGLFHEENQDLYLYYSRGSCSGLINGLFAQVDLGLLVSPVVVVVWEDGKHRGILFNDHLMNEKKL